MAIIKETIHKIREWDTKRRSFITIEELGRNALISSLCYEVRKNKVNMLIGSGFVVVGVLTLPVPTGSLFLIGLGIGLFFSSIPYNKVIGNIWKDFRFMVFSKLVIWGLI